MPEFQAIGAACKRMRNILRQAAEKGIDPAAKFEYLPEAGRGRKNLMAYMESTSARVEEFRNNKEYLEALLLLFDGKRACGRIFDKVMVMVEDEKVGRTGWRCSGHC